MTRFLVAFWTAMLILAVCAGIAISVSPERVFAELGYEPAPIARASATASPCPAPQPGERIDIYIRQHNGELLATCRRIPARSKP